MTGSGACLGADHRPAVQLYACNILNMGDSKIISVHANTARQIVRNPHFHGDVQVVDFTPITSMYGAVHCSSQVSLELPYQCTCPVPVQCACPWCKQWQTAQQSSSWPGSSDPIASASGQGLVQVVKRTPRRKHEKPANGSSPAMVYGSPANASALSSSLSNSLRIGSDPRYPR